MADLSADTQRIEHIETGETAYPVAASTTLYLGTAVGENGSGYAKNVAASTPFLGFNMACKVDNSAGVAGAVYAMIKTRGLVQLSVAGASAITANDRPAVYASDGNTFSLTNGGTDVLIGWVRRWLSGTTCIVEYDAAAVKAALHA